MKRSVKLVTTKILELCKIYENYLWAHASSNLVITIDNNMITFYLFNATEEIDEFSISFIGNEMNYYCYLSIEIIAFFLKNVIIHRDTNILYNNKQKPYLKIIVTKAKIMDSIINSLNEDNFIDNTKLISTLKKIPIKKCDDDIVTNFDERIEYTKKKLRREK